LANVLNKQKTTMQVDLDYPLRSSGAGLH